MKNPAACRLLWFGLAAAGLAACQSTAPDTAPPAEAARTETAPAVVATASLDVAPMELDDSQLSAWNYLAGKYDADGDGRITPDECDRDNFERLDRDGDGALTRDDYASSGAMMEEMMKGMRAQAAVFTYFQADDDPATLEREELSWSFREYDVDQDGALTESEFQDLAEDKAVEIPSEFGLGEMMTGESDPWTALLEGMDADADLSLAAAEVEGFFDERDDGDGVWTLESRTRPTEAAAERGEPASGARVGTVAPDFRLSPPEGGEAVTLSSFQGEKPVALIFGSYT